MAQVNLSLPDDLQQFVNDEVEAGQFQGASAYIEALIAKAKQGKQRLEALLIEGLDSGDPIPLDAHQWSKIRDEVTEKIGHGR